MTARTIEHQHSSGLLWIILCIVLLALAIPNVLSIPVSNHAIVQHSAETWSPARVAEEFQNRRSWETWYSDREDKFLFLIQLEGNTWGGRFVGATTQNPITCFSATRSRWDNIIARDGYIRVT